ncbi:hypothetical protein IFHNHDMJ_00316 [Synechococcus sp. CBW1107]|nr:hypothetical protein IFHNHDMJ_00316 [Synechococcus sp. CBW1107]
MNSYGMAAWRQELQVLFRCFLGQGSVPNSADVSISLSAPEVGSVLWVPVLAEQLCVSAGVHDGDGARM